MRYPFLAGQSSCPALPAPVVWWCESRYRCQSARQLLKSSQHAEGSGSSLGSAGGSVTAGAYSATGSRDDALANADGARRAAYQHRGRFVSELLPKFDREGGTRGSGDQFSFRLKKDGGFYANSTDPVSAEQFHALLDGVERQLVAMGNGIFSGDIRVNPYRHANKTPCEFCDYAGVCRIDRWTHEFRALPAPPLPPET